MASKVFRRVKEKRNCCYCDRTKWRRTRALLRCQCECHEGLTPQDVVLKRPEIDPWFLDPEIIEAFRSKTRSNN